MVSKTVGLEKLIWEGEDVRFDAAARGRLNRELHMQFEVRAESRGCYQAAWIDWRELVSSTKALCCCVPAKSNFTLILCGWGKNWQRGEKKRDVKHSYVLISLSAFFSILFLLSAGFPPEWKTVCMHSLLSVVLVGIPLYIF